MKETIISILIAVILIGGSFILKNNVSFAPENNKNNFGENNQNVGTENGGARNNVSVSDGKQIIYIHAKGGYQPTKSLAKAGLETILRFDTVGTFDCSSAVRIPSMNISKILPQTGSTDINIGVQPIGLFQGTCGMGMYPFEVDFR